MVGNAQRCRTRRSPTVTGEQYNDMSLLVSAGPPRPTAGASLGPAAVIRPRACPDPSGLRPSAGGDPSRRYGEGRLGADLNEARPPWASIHHSRTSCRRAGAPLAASDLHAGRWESRRVVDAPWPGSERDWLLIAGDVAERVDDLAWALRTLRELLVWAPGDHELWTRRSDPLQLCDGARYRYLVQMCRDLDVIAPEDPYPVWDGDGGPVAVAPLFAVSGLVPDPRCPVPRPARGDRTSAGCQESAAADRPGQPLPVGA